MAALMKWVGVLWAILGVANIVMVSPGASDAKVGFALMFNMLLFILPGLVVAGIGLALQRRNSPTAERTARVAPTTAVATAASVEARFDELERLRSRNLITEDEYKNKREDLLRIV